MATLLEALEALDPTTRARVENTLRVGSQIQELGADPEFARQLHSLADQTTKKRNPSHITDEERAKPFMEAVLAKVDERLSARDRKAAEEAATNGLADRISSYKSQHSFTDEGIKGVLEIMQNRGVADFDIAAREYMREHPAPAAPSPSATERMNWNTFEQMQSGDDKPFFYPEGRPSITDNPEAWANDTALAYLNKEIALPG